MGLTRTHIWLTGVRRCSVVGLSSTAAWGDIGRPAVAIIGFARPSVTTRSSLACSPERPRSPAQTGARWRIFMPGGPS